MLIMTNSAAEVERPAPAAAPVAPALVTTRTKSATATTTSSSAVISPSASPTLSATATTTSNKPQEPQSVLARRQFPAVVFLVLYSSPDALPSISGVFMSLSNANQECRRLRSLDSPSPVSSAETPAQTEARVKEERKRDIGRELERWFNAEGVECWVEVHEVVPRKWVDRGSVSSVTNPAGKLYENEEEDDEIVEEEEDEEYAGH